MNKTHARMAGTLQTNLGFTLIELLAVIVILAIIALIATPVVLSIIDDAKESAMLRSAEMYLSGVENAVMRENMNSGGNFRPEICKISNQSMNCDGRNIKVEVDGETPNDGIITFSKGKMITAQLIYGDTIIVKNSNGEIVKGIDYIESPNLFNGTLTPVKYDGNNWVVVSEDDEDWYDYSKQEWANAVILDSSVKKSVGDTVKVDGTEALAMYVWIPRYEYKIEGKYGKGGTSTTSPGEIEVNFVSEGVSIASKGYRVHPAFTFGDRELSGIWVGKFELSHTTKITTSMGCTTTSCSEANNLRILPDKQSLRNNTVSSFFYGIKSMEMEGNVFGIDSELADSHMIKNSEWGAVAYLTQSKYGKYGNNDYEGANKEVYANNSYQGYYTGRSGGSYGGNTAINTVYTSQTSTSQTNSYGFYTYDGYLLDYNTNTKTSTRDMKTMASTTGNITGIYDMSGGAYDYVMGAYIDSTTGQVILGASGFISLPDDKYINKYNVKTSTTTDLLTACNNGVCYGHALNEVYKWYDDPLVTDPSFRPWVIRGAYPTDGKNIGVFYTNGFSGNAYNNTSTYSVLVSNATNSNQSQKYKTYANGEVVYYDISAGKACTNYNEENSKTGYNGIDNKTGNQNSCLKFYAFNDGGSSTLNLILDHNTTATVLWNSNGDNSTGPTDLTTKLKENTANWQGTITPSNYTTGVSGRQYTVNYNGYKARLITADEIAEITGNVGWYENLPNTDKYYFDTNINTKSTTCQEGNITGCKYGWLYDRTATTCTSTGCLNNSDVETNGYWTISASNTNSTAELHQEYCDGNVNYGVSDSGRLSIVCPNYPDYYGVRPVIEVMKSNLKN